MPRKNTSTDPYVAFVYMLMRDHIPTGVLAEIIQDLEQAEDYNGGYVFTSDGVSDYAIELVSRLDAIKRKNKFFKK